MKKIIMFFLFSLLITPIISFSAALHTMEIEFSFSASDDPARQLLGYRLYQEGEQVCQTANPGETTEPGVYSITCDFLTEEGIFDFTLAALYSDGSASPQSPAFPFAITSTTPPKTDPPTDPQQPIAVISASTAGGSIPLSVTFDGTSSTTPNTSIKTYRWTFGDGSRPNTGQTASHTYTVAGTYYPQLTVVDNMGLSSTISIPIVINSPPIPTNQLPVAVIEAQLTSEADPLTFSFDASGSSDPDGTISKYKWNFGDGTTSSGLTARHSYAARNIYTVTLKVTDDKGETSTASTQISCDSPLPLNIEVGEISIDHNWVSVDFQNSFTDPVVIAGPPSMVGAQPVLVRIRNINKRGFEIRLQEWDYQEGSHREETLSYIVIEGGTYNLDNGSKLEAGYFSGTRIFKQIGLQQPYNITPVIMTQVVTENETAAVTGRVQNINQDYFEFKLQEMESSERDHPSESIGYIAWEPGKGNIAGLIYEIGLTAKKVTHEWFDLNFETEFPEQPFFLAGMQTCNGNNPATVRSKELSKTATLINIDEEKSKDEELIHQKEAIGYLAIGAGNG